MAADRTLWHYAPDAAARVVRRADGRLDLHLVAGCWSARPPADEVVTLRHGGPGAVTTAATMTPLDDAFAAALQDTDDRPVDGPRPVALTPYRLALSRRRRGNRYYEAVVGDVAPGSVVEYRFSTATAGAADLELGPYRVLVAAPQFAPEHVIGGRYGDLVDPEPTWIGHVFREGGVTHVRVDLDDIDEDGPVPVRLRVAGRWYDADPAAVARTDRPQVPILDWPGDSVTLSVRDEHAEPVAVEAFGRRVEESQAGGPGRARLLIAHFCIQAINDLLEVPFGGKDPANPAYRPPRTYMQVTMADEHGQYSSRPGVTDTQPGGYRDGLTMHRRFGVRYHLALNGGVLVLAAHDCPDDLARMSADAAAGLLHPAIAGYGSHRIPYYSAETNVRDITEGLDAIRTHLGARLEPQVFYPDQRLYRQRAETLAALRTEPVRYVVLDSSTGYYDNAASVVAADTAKGVDLGPGMLWRDERSGAYVLFIDTVVKDNILQDELDDARPQTWKPEIGVRRRFMRLALDPALRERNLLTFGDDFEKVCNNGWFEGSPRMRDKWASFLGWAAAHATWLHVVTTDDLRPESDCVGTIDVRQSIDATLDPGGTRTVDLDGNDFHYDTWQNAWRATPAAWLNSTLGAVTDVVEEALRFWPGHPDDELIRTAWLSFLMHQHENAWNMQALEGSSPNDRPIGDPEEFTIVEGLQVRNSLVWLKASVWAAWAAEPSAGGRFVDDGPVGERITALATTVPELDPLVCDATRWDADPQTTLVLYNADALVVVDRNGGRVTHAFVRRGGRARTVSGTFKSYQYRDGAGIECDGYVVQNTVWTPNHRYVGADLDHLGRRRVDWTYRRPSAGDAIGSSTVTRIVPDNFNAYACERVADDRVRCTHRGGGAPAGPVDQRELLDLLQADGAARRAGREGTTWHEDTEFHKTFTLSGTTLRVDYTGVEPGHRVDNEFCVDLFAGVHRGELLERHVDTPGVITVAMPERGAVRVGLRDGCRFTEVSLLRDVAHAEGRGLGAEFLQLHRVLTDTVQVEATDTAFGYDIDLAAAPS